MDYRSGTPVVLTCLHDCIPISFWDIQMKEDSPVTPDYESPFEFTGRADEIILHQYPTEVDPLEELKNSRMLNKFV